MKIELNEKQEKEFEDWKKSFGELPNLGPLGGHFGLNVIFTNKGNLYKAISWDGKEINLSWK